MDSQSTPTRRPLANAISVFLPMAWMGLIFAGSTQLLSGDATAPYVWRIVSFFFPTPQEFDTIHLVVRKCGHLTEYGILALLVLHALRTLRLSARQWATYTLSLAAAVAYAASDEFHQTFVPGRYGCVTDVGIDFLGASAGLLLFLALDLWRRKHLSVPASQTKPADSLAGEPCFSCKNGTLRLDTQDCTFDLPDGRTLTVRDCWVERCDCCGETVFPGETSRCIERAIAAHTAGATVRKV